MILLPVSEAHAFDYLAILWVKRDHGLDVKDEIDEVERHLNRQIGHVETILESTAFRTLVAANDLTFDAIDLAHKDQIRASEVQEINRRRFLAKQALQEAFWPDKPLSERKTGLTSSR